MDYIRKLITRNALFSTRYIALVRSLYQNKKSFLTLNTTSFIKTSSKLISTRQLTNLETLSENDQPINVHFIYKLNSNLYNHVNIKRFITEIQTKYHTFGAYHVPAVAKSYYTLKFCFFITIP